MSSDGANGVGCAAILLVIVLLVLWGISAAFGWGHAESYISELGTGDGSSVDNPCTMKKAVENAEIGEYIYPVSKDEYAFRKIYICGGSSVIGTRARTLVIIKR